ncbi:unnamed protein product [Allacma fusca]|uniref:Receptor ligand binding region domain-containing protein n=1 Tax=Allacma fusca TaxID=39272 RepID=A0A8J2KCZ0_9HEXA|nr:unnamed protein product [Allacma fusca]
MKVQSVLLIIWAVRSAICLPPVIRIGGIFPEELRSTPVEVAFKYAVFSVNRERKLLGNSTLVYRTLYYKNSDIFQATKLGCQLISEGISALFASGVDLSLESHLKSLSFALDLPLILPTSSFYDSEPFWTRNLPTSFPINSFPLKLAPTKSLLAFALRDAVTFFNWTRVAVIYEEHDANAMDPSMKLIPENYVRYKIFAEKFHHH